MRSADCRSSCITILPSSTVDQIILPDPGLADRWRPHRSPHAPSVAAQRIAAQRRKWFISGAVNCITATDLSTVTTSVPVLRWSSGNAVDPHTCWLSAPQWRGTALTLLPFYAAVRRSFES